MIYDEKGYLYLCYGEGKNKTSSALGMALRAMGSNWSVYLGQFLKNESAWAYGEIKMFKQLNSEDLTIRQFGAERISKGCRWSDLEIISARKGWKEVKKILSGKDKTIPPYKMVILDELNVIIDLGFIDIDEVVEAIKNRPYYMEVAITGRGKHDKLIEIADVVTEMLEVKHYYKKGIMARQGIEY